MLSVWETADNIYCPVIGYKITNGMATLHWCGFVMYASKCNILSDE